MSKKHLFIGSLLLFVINSIVSIGQIMHQGSPISQDIALKSTTVSANSTVTMPTFELPQNDTSNIVKHRAAIFAHQFEVDLTTDNSGTWYTSSTGQRIWKLNIYSADAASINVIFSKYKLPQGGKLFIYNEDQSHVIGAFTEANNKASGILPTMPVHGDKVTIEYQEPINPQFDAELAIGSVNHDYLGVFSKYGYFGDSESCEENLTCHDEDTYNLTGRSVVKLIINGNELMTGTLVNNTNQDGTPYVITAAHGYEDSDYVTESTLFIFNYQTPSCFNTIEGTKEQSIAGGTMREYSPETSSVSLDYVLVEISATPPLAYMPYYAGWNLSTTSPTNVFCIHHPAGDIKKISFDNDALDITTLNLGSFKYATNGHWEVKKWDIGVTEGGSSGSGIFNPSGQLIGGLSAGAASCSSPYTDYFFRIDQIWQASSSLGGTISQWLDSNNTGTNELGGYDPCLTPSIERLTNVSADNELASEQISSNNYVAGTNDNNITYFVEKFENYLSTDILGIYYTTTLANANSPVSLSIWEGYGTPETEVYTSEFIINEWDYYKTDIDPGTIGGTDRKTDYTMRENFILFDTPITVSKDYFIGFNSDNNTTDYFALAVVNNNNQNTAYYFDTEWHPYTELSNYSKSTSLLIDVVVQTNSEDSAITDTKNTFDIYPNPIKSGEHLSIRTDNYTANTPNIYDMLGRKFTTILESKINNITNINIDALPAGVYIVELDNNKQMFQKM